jgi:cyclic pyranopterin monophosphate synthase
MGQGHETGLTHLDSEGSARMVDVGAKPETERRAVAVATVRMKPETAAAVERGDGPKGDVLGPARIAGIGAAKRAGELVPLAHPLPLSFADVSGEVDAEAGTVSLRAEARCVGRTGVEIEAMAAASIAALTVYDMVKGLERGVSIDRIELVEKSGGRSGEWSRDQGGAGESAAGEDDAGSPGESRG